jgi:polysaccharide biosynthesis/export protein
MYRIACIAWVLLSIGGCSSLGISTSPPQNNLTQQAESVLSRAPRNAALSRELDMNVLVAHFLQPGDVLLVEPVDLDSEIRFAADQKVLADGTIDLGKFGRVIVAGLTLELAENHIEKTIVNTGIKATQINVRLLEPVHRIYVLGEVASPGSYPFTGNETVLDGILAAGGLTTQANACKVVLARPTQPPSCRVALPICYREITQLGDTTTNYQLQPGDRIFVASRTLCDDLQFWKNNKTCERCCKCQAPCSDPSVASFGNRISPNLPAPPPTPEARPKDSAASNSSSSKSELMEDDKSPSPLSKPSLRNMLELDSNREDAANKKQDGQLDLDPKSFSTPD